MAGVIQHNGIESRVREGAAKPFPLGQWQHVAFVADGAVMRLYRNGMEVARSPCEGICPLPPIKHLTIGCQSSVLPSDRPDRVKPVCFWKGRIDELAVFYHALSSEQIQQLFEGRGSEPITSPSRK